LVILRLYSRVVPCEIRKIEVYDIDFSRPSPDIIKSPPSEFTATTGLGAIMSPFRESRFHGPKARIANPQISRGSGAQRPGYRPTRVHLHATVPSGSGPTRKHTAKFEPATWSWAQMTSGSGAPKRILSGETFKFKLQRPN
jgi:hypothetical protein